MVEGDHALTVAESVRARTRPQKAKTFGWRKTLVCFCGFIYVSNRPDHLRGDLGPDQFNWACIIIRLQPTVQTFCVFYQQVHTKLAKFF